MLYIYNYVKFNILDKKEKKKTVERYGRITRKITSARIDMLNLLLGPNSVHYI